MPRGSRRYLESLSTYPRRRMLRAEKARVDEVLYVLAALTLRHRPGVPGIRSTFGTGLVRTVDETTLMPDDSLSIDERAMAPWQTLMWSLMKDIARAMGVRTDVPFRDLSDKEKGMKRVEKFLRQEVCPDCGGAGFR